ncbi:MAG: restriction endonuclease subunit S [Candidatus Cloacimonetes bacterium]|nr:restriction endonuclease subunit S [Candidatus Cloacimonadota bacterium]
MNNYKLVKLDDICLKITDGSHYSPKAVSKGYPMLSVKDMRHNDFFYKDCKYVSEKDYQDLVKGDCKPLLNDVLIAKDGSYLKHVFVIKKEKNQVILSSIGILRPDVTIVNSDYLKYYLHSDSVKSTVSKKYVSGSALPRIILKNFGEIEVISKSLPVQKKIAKILSELDAKIELNNRINQELEAMAKTLYDYWFVQFDFPDKNGKPYKSSGGKMIFNEELKREVPSGWEVDTVETFLLKEQLGKKVPAREYKNEGNIPVIDQSTDFICGFTNNNDSLIKANEPRIVFGDHTRILKLINFNFARGADGTQVILSNNERIPQYLFFQILSMIDLSNYGYARHFKFLKQSKIVVPEKTISQNYNALVKPFWNEIKSKIFENQQLTKLRDWLLPMLMNGQVTVGDGEES